MIHAEKSNAILQIGLVDYREGTSPDLIIPSDLTTVQIRHIIQLFTETSVRAKKSGFDGIQIHAGHGLFLNQILSPAFNHRTDEYGKELAKQVDIPVIVVGGYRSAEHMNKLLNDSKVEFFSLSRPLIREPDLVKRWQSGDLSAAKCVSCNTCYRTGNSRCIFRIREQR